MALRIACCAVSAFRVVGSGAPPFVLRNVTRSSHTGEVCALLNVTNGSPFVRLR